MSTPISIRAAGRADLDAMLPLLLADAHARQAQDPILWALAPDAEARLRASVEATLTDPPSPLRHRWHLAEANGAIIGLVHTILVPVPPIYAGVFGPPGLIMEDSCLAAGAPTGTDHALLAAAERDLTQDGPRYLLGTSRAGGAWEGPFADRGYGPLTDYFAKSGLSAAPMAAPVRAARESDVPGIVAASARHRAVLHDLDPFWKPHAEADARFGAWMAKSLTLTDRDMFVAETAGTVTGYGIAQPATPLHFPAPHAVGAVGVIDDFYHPDFADPEPAAAPKAEGAGALLAAAEAALARRDVQAAIVVCPAAWRSKIAVLDRAGFRRAITWYLRPPEGAAQTEPR